MRMRPRRRSFARGRMSRTLVPVPSSYPPVGEGDAKIEVSSASRALAEPIAAGGGRHATREPSRPSQLRTGASADHPGRAASRGLLRWLPSPLIREEAQRHRAALCGSPKMATGAAAGFSAERPYRSRTQASPVRPRCRPTGDRCGAVSRPGAPARARTARAGAPRRGCSTGPTGASRRPPAGPLR